VYRIGTAPAIETMPENNPVLATSRLHLRTENGKAPVLGTCFAFRHPKYFLTAAHCITDAKPEDVIIAGEDRSKLGLVKRAILHPSADLAILEIDRDDMDELPNYFRRAAPRPQMGMNFFAYGYPTIEVNKFGPRVFSGIFQTFHSHVSHMHMGDSKKTKYRYLAGELSTPAPRGLSGGPVFRSENPDEVLALVTENLEVGTIIDTVERVEENGERFSLETSRIILYGLSVILTEVEDWLVANIPLPTQKGHPAAPVSVPLVKP
jgi:Trypsin-like peptidase domain